MSDSNRHINFKLMRDHILSLQDGGQQSPRTGKKYWRSLDELADTPQFREFVAREFPQQAEGWNDPVERRTFMKLMGASLALAGLSGCVFQPPEKIVPYVNQPEGYVPGKPLFYATAMPLLGISTPILVRSNEGRPTKIEGNPDHPNNRPLDFPAGDSYRDPRGSSATDIFSQASILDLYDPDRSQTITYREDIRTWTQFVGAIRSALDEQRSGQGAGLRFLTETIISPSLGTQINDLLKAFPQAKWHQWEPANGDNRRAGAVSAFGQPVHTTYRFDLAQRVVSIDSDFLNAMPGTLRYAREFFARRRVTEANRDMNRLYVVETSPSNTGACADHTWTIKPSEIEAIVRELAADARQGLSQYPWIEPLMRDLEQHRGASIVIAGESQPPLIHALVHALNNKLGNVGKTVFYTDPLEFNSVDQRQSLDELVGDLDGGRVQLLVILGGNPVHSTPLDKKLDLTRLEKAKLRVHLSEYKNETSELCHWHVPATHFLETWGDTRSYDGTVTIMQPLIEPLHEGKSAYELLAVFSKQYDRNTYDIVRGYWQTQQAGSADFEKWWRQSIHDGFVANSALPAKTVTPSGQIQNQSAPASATNGYELVFRTDPSIYDGRFANNAWLQELPKPLTKTTWDNVAVVSPATAQSIAGMTTNGGAVKGREHYVPLVDLVSPQGPTMRTPLWIMPGQPDNVITVYLGYGRRLAGRVGGNPGDTPVGFDAYKIRTSFEPWFVRGVQARPTGLDYPLATTQLHFNLEDPNFSEEPRDIVRSQTLEAFLSGAQRDGSHGDRPAHDGGVTPEHPTIYPEYDYKNQAENAPNYAWGMALDLNNCIGCNACTIACQAENNITTVGKTEVMRSREMHWIRVDTYYQGDSPSMPEGTSFMPVPCMHCEKAPCEPVCPVHATVHSAEGLNDMVYNRCVGTKYCSNNCPYKVRRFNFFLYQNWDEPLHQLRRNPEVTVRSRGVMEKCTYCVQRIQNAKIQSELEGRRVHDGEIVTACQAVCPTDVIVFGDINDPHSRVNKLKADQRNYSLLGELNTQPRTTYLSHLKNPNPEIKAPESANTEHRG